MALAEAIPFEPAAQTAPDLRTIFVRDAGYVWSVLRRMGVREADLEDLTHDVFVAVHRALSSYDPSRPLRPWLFGVAFRVASDHRRRAYVRREHPTGTQPESVDSAATPDERLSSEQDRALVLRALDRLDDHRRAILVMHHFEEHPVPEIAEALGIPLNTAYSRLRAARQAFVQAIRSITAEASSKRGGSNE